MKRGTKLAIGIGALLLAIAAGTGAYAMRAGDSDMEIARSPDVSREDQPATAPSDAAGTAMCVADHPDCQDVIAVPPDASGDDAKCAADGPCDMVAGGDAACPPGMACIEPWLMNPPVCPDGIAPEACYPQPCAILDGPGTGEGSSGGDPSAGITPMPPAEVTPVSPPDSPMPCLPVDPCLLPMPLLPDSAEAPAMMPHPCPPIDPCMAPEPLPMLDSDERLRPAPMPCMPHPVDPCAGPDPRVRCLPPGCTVASDGSVSCAEPPPITCPSDDPAVSCPASGEDPAGGGAMPRPPTEPIPE